MAEILGQAQTVRELLKGVKYAIDYYQRDYKWQQKQIQELLDDLCDKFLEGYDESHERSRVGEYPHYFLGSIIVSERDSCSFLVDGQQRLTSLTLLLLLLRTLQRERPDAVAVDELIYSEKFGQKSFNLAVEERIPCMEALFESRAFDPAGQSESVQNIVERYHDIEEGFSEELRGAALPHFTDWLLENVHLVVITAFSDEDAYTIFETMNDRGLSLSPTEMVKGYVLSNITNPARRTTLNEVWRSGIRELSEAGKDVEPDAFKAWFRTQHATSIRKREKGAKPEDFDRIGTEFHRWLRDSSEVLGLRTSSDFDRFIERDFQFFTKQYLSLLKAAQGLAAGLQHVRYNADHRFTLQFMLLLAPLTPDDLEGEVRQRVELVARYLDILLARRIWNSQSIGYKTLQYAMFLVMREIRSLSARELARCLYAKLLEEPETFAPNRRNENFGFHVVNGRKIKLLLARLTDFVETQSGAASRYLEYVTEQGSARYEMEHILAAKPERHGDAFSNEVEISTLRDRICGHLLLPKSFNASYGDLAYEDKLPHYQAQNLLARSLHPLCYERNPGFLRFIERTGLPFHPVTQFDRQALEERTELYRQLATLLWNPETLRSPELEV